MTKLQIFSEYTNKIERIAIQNQDKFDAALLYGPESMNTAIPAETRDVVAQRVQCVGLLHARHHPQHMAGIRPGIPCKRYTISCKITSGTNIRKAEMELAGYQM